MTQLSNNPSLGKKQTKKRNRKAYVMQKQNQLKSILMELGFEDYKPTAALLKKLGMTRLRFFQIFENTGKNEITVTEKESIENWLAEILNKPVNQINFMVTGTSEHLVTQPTSNPS